MENISNPTNDFHKDRTTTYFQVADANWGMYNSDTFQTVEAARDCIKNEYRERNKKDGHDKYWNDKPLVILKITTTTQVVELDNPKK